MNKMLWFVYQKFGKRLELGAIQVRNGHGCASIWLDYHIIHQRLLVLPIVYYKYTIWSNNNSYQMYVILMFFIEYSTTNWV